MPFLKKISIGKNPQSQKQAKKKIGRSVQVVEGRIKNQSTENPVNENDLTTYPNTKGCLIFLDSPLLF